MYCRLPDALPAAADSGAPTPVNGGRESGAGAPDWFRTGIDRRGTSSSKWEKYAGTDILPFWVADMDLPTAPFVIDAVRRRLEHPVLGYTKTPPATVDAFLDWLRRRCGWRAEAEWLVWLPGVVPGFNVAARAFGGRRAVVPTPVYPPFLRVAANSSLEEARSPLALAGDRWEMDFDDLAAKLVPDAALMFCNPHNPTGRCYGRAELERLGEVVLAGGGIVVSDEIHCGILLDADRRHLSVAGMDPELARRSVSLYSPTKAYNMPGLGVAVAVIPDPELRARYDAARDGFVSGVSPLAYAAATAAWNDRSDWLPNVNAFLRANADRVTARVGAMEGVRTTPVEATCLSWIDATSLAAPGSPASFLQRHGIGLSPGEDFGAPGFVRFNFGCSEGLLEEGLNRLETAVRAAAGGAR